MIVGRFCLKEFLEQAIFYANGGPNSRGYPWL